MSGFFSYTGNIDFFIKKELVYAFRDKLKESSLSVAFQKRISYLLDELISNINEYYSSNAIQETVQINCAMNDERAELTFSNYVKSEDKQELIKQLDLINSLKPEALDDLFKKRLKENTSEKNAGIGLLSVKMKTGNNFEFSFKDESNPNLLVLKISINLHHGQN